MERPLQRNCLYEKSINIMTIPKRKEEVIMYKKLNDMPGKRKKEN